MIGDIKRYIKYKWKTVALFFLTGAILGMGLRNVQLENQTVELEQELRDAQERLLISNDKLKQIEMRNEAERYIQEENAE